MKIDAKNHDDDEEKSLFLFQMRMTMTTNVSKNYYQNCKQPFAIDNNANPG